MLLYGKNITSSADSLQKVEISYLYHSLRNPKPEISACIRRLRIVRTLDSKKYAQQKKALPYIVCGVFNPPYRRTENFAYIEYFILDIDHITVKQHNIDTLQQTLAADDRVLMCFKSPGEDGLKLLFRLSERCYDAGLYALFYKVFVHQFSIQYQLEQIIDTKTSDVTRACFVSIDPSVSYRPDATPVKLSTFLDSSNSEGLFRQKREIERVVKTQQENLPILEKDPQKKDPDHEAMAQIKARLNPKYPPNSDRPPVITPPVLNEVMEDLTAYIQETGVVVAEIINIQYGKKIRLNLGLKQAEINLFFGKRGFSVVKSPRSGTSEELNELCADLIGNFLLER